MHCHYRVCPRCKHHMDPELYCDFKIWLCNNCGMALDRGFKRFIQRIRNRGY